MNQNADFAACLASYVATVQAVHDGRMSPALPASCRMVITTEAGRRYTRVIQSLANGSQRSVVVFVDGNGDILKPASWRGPVKGARGNIFALASRAA
jgi:hypothetical protein